MKTAAYQFAVSGNIEANAAAVENALRSAKNQSIELVVFPECCLTGYPPHDISKASDVDFYAINEACERLHELASELGIAFIIGTICRENGKIYNRALFFKPNGETQSYDKRALWGWDRDNFSAGGSAGVFELNGVRIGVRICYEVRFPELFRELYKEKTDVNVIMFYDVSDNDAAERYELIKGHVRTRAVENICTTISVNTSSPLQSAPTAVFGRSGEVLAQCPKNEAGFVVYDYEKAPLDFGERGRKELSDMLLDEPHI